MASAPQSTINSLQAGRAIAAIAVVIHHSEAYVREEVAPLPTLLARPMSFGYLGVDFFFVLSGFIIYYVNARRVKRPGWTRSYATSRVTRIYSPYLPIGIALAVAYTLLPQLRHGVNDWNWFSTLTLLPSNAEPALRVAWSLQHEIIFYALAWVFLSTGRVLLGCCLWAAVIVGTFAVTGYQTWPALSLYDLEFLFGIAAAWCFMNEKFKHDLLLLVLGSAAVVAFFVIGDRNWSVIFGTGMAFLILPMIRREAAGMRVVPVGIFLGEASYAIYLIHLPVLSVVVRVGRHLPPLPVAVAAIVASTIAGCVYMLIIERPLLAASRAAIARLRGQRSVPARAHL